MNSKIWLSSPHMGGTEQKYVQNAFDENWIAPLGPNVTLFEEKIQSFLDQDIQVAALSSGTAALHLALILLGVDRDDEVICQSMTFSASANPIKYLGATPVFVDSEETTWNMDPNALEEAIKDRIQKGKKPKAIVAVHLYGMPYQHDALRSIANKYEIPIVEDSAEALGSTFKGQKCGTLGDISILSFNGNKIITTSGGGALVTKTKQLKDKAVFLATQARDNAPHYQHSHVGYNYRLSNVSAGIGCGQMEVLSDRVNQRRKNQEFYTDLFQDHAEIKVMQEPTKDYYSNFWLSALTFEGDKAYEKRETLRISLNDKYNIETRPLWKPMHLQPIFADAPYYGANVSEELFNKGLCLPSGSNLTEEELSRIKQAFQELV
ncbi:aminotransferase class I/II-fold pyridoxal phosphate-dependent enzyme [Weeksellaceae bacterium KMM 9713]|uniref:Aminotransferase class I/II-fold pyridoxal phosphate-dependent enzyme n=1 Tax=Profundicola chukchiensis TaxID=2961959 RepID=A0A9X4MZR4_9FLAO|nr:aminotransferase class I/II-fold pyridoxal phosphate-dependent enzyme [Profundicola chukchiensis]MDG4946657.1 aminotransferase class I/II-fold pyridoxal phosphate-dependent enzyme [Profundicola chukchiensis]